MKLAEALADRADLQTRYTQLGLRVQQSARYQEGETPAEDAGALLAEMDRIAAQLEALVVRINVQNLATEVSPGVSMTAALARRDTLRRLQKARTDLADAATAKADRYSRTELRSFAALDVKALREEADAFAKEARELDTLIQGINWTTEVDERGPGA
jgi:hypothetical protein